MKIIQFIISAGLLMSSSILPSFQPSNLKCTNNNEEKDNINYHITKKNNTDIDEKPKLVSIAGKVEDSDRIQMDIDYVTEYLKTGTQNVPVVIQHSTMKKSAIESATLTLVYRFEAVGCEAKTIEHTEVYTTGDDNGNVTAQIEVIKEKNHTDVAATGIYKMTATVSYGYKSVTANFSLEIIPVGAVVRYEYDATRFDGDPESEEGDFWYTYDKQTGYFSEFNEAIEFSDEHSGTNLWLLKDNIDVSYAPAGNDVIIDANGHNIGFTEEESTFYLSIYGKVYLTNLTGIVYLETTDYINSNIEVMNVVDDFNGIVLYPDISFVERSSSRPLISFYDGIHGAQNIAISLPGYTAVNIEGGVAIEKTSDRPFAVLEGNSKDTYKFNFFKSLKDAFDNADVGDGNVYVQIYANAFNFKRCSLYHYIGEISEEQYAKLRTFVRVDDTKSDFYTVENGTFKFKYSNIAGTEPLYSEDELSDFLADLEIGTKATLNIPAEFEAGREDGNVIIENNWTQLDSSTEVDKPIDEAGAYIINGPYTIDAKYIPSFMSMQTMQMAFYSKDSAATINLKGKNMGGGSKSIEATLFGEYSAINIDNAIANIGTSLDYEGSCSVKKTIVDNNGYVIAGNRNALVNLGTVKLGKGTCFNGINVSLTSGTILEEKQAALTISDTAFATLRDCKITSNEINGINNKGILNINGGEMTINNDGLSDTIYGIYNEGDATFSSGNEDKGLNITMNKGTGICSIGTAPNIKMSAADIVITDNAAVGIDIQDGVFSVRSGPYEYYPQNNEYPGVSVTAGNTALKIGENVKWEISGSRNNVSFKGGSFAIDSQSDKSLSDIVNFNMSYGIYYGQVRIKEKTGIKAVKSALPILNFYCLQNEDNSISIHNAEGELLSFLTKDVTEKVEYTLPCFICPNFYQSTVYGCLIPDVTKAIIIGQGEHVLHFSKDPSAPFEDQKNCCLIFGEVEDSCVIDIPKGATLALDGGLWINQGIGVTAPATLINIHGGTFRNGERGKGNGVFLSTGIYGVYFEADQQFIKEELNHINKDDVNIAIHNVNGNCELNGGLYDATILNDGGTTEINDGAICASVGEIYRGKDKGNLTINSAKFYGYYDLPESSDWAAVFSYNNTSEKRLVVGQNAGDNAIIPFDAKIIIEGSDQNWRDILILSETNTYSSLKLKPNYLFTVTGPSVTGPSSNGVNIGIIVLYVAIGIVGAAIITLSIIFITKKIKKSPLNK